MILTVRYAAARGCQTAAGRLAAGFHSTPVLDRKRRSHWGLTVLTVYAFLYGKTYLALSGVGKLSQERAQILQNTALVAALNTQFVFQIGVFTAIPMILGFILEQGFLTAHIHTLRGKILETVLSLRFFIFQYGIVYKLHVNGNNTSLMVYAFSWMVLAVLFILFQLFTFIQKASVNFQLLLRLLQSVAFLILIAGVAAAVVITTLSIGDVFACILGFIPTGWGILSIAVAWKPVMKKLRLWKSARSLARLYDAGMGIVIFIPVAIFLWFPFVSTFQTRLMFNQAFSRGLEISRILAGNNPNSGL